jgi:hypothetical protein
VKYAIRDDVLAWMDERFDGDLDDTVEKAVKHVRRQRLIEGPLWDEIAAFALRVMFRNRLLNAHQHLNKYPVSALPEEERPAALIVAEVGSFATWFHVEGGRRVNLGDLTKADCWLIAAAHDKTARTAVVRREVFVAIAEALKPKQTIRQRFSEDELQAFTRTVTKRSGQEPGAAQGKTAATPIT